MDTFHKIRRGTCGAQLQHVQMNQLIQKNTVFVVLEALAVVYSPVVEVGAALCGADLHKPVMLCNTGNQQHTNLQIALVAICSDFPSP